jgi:hypothetical protein
MFERYTSPARRVVFFARYEASHFGSDYLETEHLLLGLIRECKVLAELLRPKAGAESIRSQIEARDPVRERISTSVDLPLSKESRSALAYAADEAAALDHRYIDCGHLVLGLLRTKSIAAALLEENGVRYREFRETMRGLPSMAQPEAVEPFVHPSEEPVTKASHATSVSLRPLIGALEGLLDVAGAHLSGQPPLYGEQRLKRKPWTRKEALGHLVDLAATHHQWFARALTEPNLAVSGSPQESWVFALPVSGLPLAGSGESVDFHQQAPDPHAHGHSGGKVDHALPCRNRRTHSALETDRPLFRAIPGYDRPASGKALTAIHRHARPDAPTCATLANLTAARSFVPSSCECSPLISPDLRR